MAFVVETQPDVWNSSFSRCLFPCLFRWTGLSHVSGLTSPRVEHVTIN